MIVYSEPKENPVGRYLVDWSIKHVNSKCVGNEKRVISTKEANTKKRITDIAECARSCKGYSPLFFFGSESGCTIYGCICQCELVTYPDESCSIEADNNGGLYIFDKGKIKINKRGIGVRNQ